MLKVTRFEILRDVEATGRKALPLPERPVRVATIIDESHFLETKIMKHNMNVFLEDRVHDWDWSEGKLWYYTRVAERADVLIVYELQDDKAVNKG